MLGVSDAPSTPRRAKPAWVKQALHAILRTGTRSQFTRFDSCVLCSRLPTSRVPGRFRGRFEGRPHFPRQGKVRHYPRTARMNTRLCSENLWVTLNAEPKEIIVGCRTRAAFTGCTKAIALST